LLGKTPGTTLASVVGVRNLVLRLALTVIALVGSATRLHAHHADAIDTAQEMNRCLRLVNVATTRRQTPMKVIQRRATFINSLRPTMRLSVV
jgi:hypothetical protein